MALLSMRLCAVRDPATAYAAFLFRDGRMRGAILVGHPTLAVPVRRAIETDLNFSSLLLRAPTGEDVTHFLRLHTPDVSKKES